MLLRIPVCFICDEKYVMPTAVAITSAIMNKNGDTMYEIYVVANNLSNESINILKSMETESARIIIINANIDEKFERFKIANFHVTTSALIKFELPKLLPYNLEKVLYMDGDVIVQKDLALILNEDIEDVYAGVVSDGPTVSAENFRKRHNLKHSPYFNSGVLLLNLKKMREEHISELLLDYKFRTYLTERRFMDQDTFNAVLKNKVKYLSFFYNMQHHVWFFNKKLVAEHYGMRMVSSKNEWIREAFIIHFTYRKPWNYFGFSSADIWLHYYLLSPFKDIVLHREMVNELNEYDKYETARIDIKNFGSADNKVTIEYCSDATAKVHSPEWFKDTQGSGIIVHSMQNSIELRTKCTGCGTVNLKLRGKGCSDSYGKRYPVWICVTSFRLDGKELFKEPQLVCYDKPFVYNFIVTDGQVVKIYVEWQSAVDILAKERVVNLKRIDEMQQKTIRLEKAEAATGKKLRDAQKKVAQLERAIGKTEKELKDVKNGWSFKIGRVITWLPRKLR